eukprot:jgi/Tetstr1/430868/TSEL_002010.t1
MEPAATVVDGKKVQPSVTEKAECKQYALQNFHAAAEHNSFLCNPPGLLDPACAAPARFPARHCQPGLYVTHLRPAMLQLDFRFQYPYPMTTLQHVLRKGGTSVYWTGCG